MASEPVREILLTGATGFIGQVLLERLAAEPRNRVICLMRDLKALPRQYAGHSNVETLRGDVTDPTTLASIPQGATVVHLAAATGAASDDDLHRINVDGTRNIVDACANANVAHLVFVSSIAACFDRLDEYPYGRSKQEAENVVRSSNINSTIVRPTIVLGAGSPIGETLFALSALPVVPIPGGGHIQVQPVDVEDVARAIAAIVDRGPHEESLVEVGGPESLTMRELLRRMRQHRSGSSGPIVGLPLWPLRLMLKVARAVLGDKSPLSPGQLVPFSNDGTAAPSSLMTSLADSLTAIDSTFQLPAETQDRFESECQTFTRYLTGREATPYVIEKYRQLHAGIALGSADELDRKLVEVAARGPWRSQLADAFARRFRPFGPLRRKLALLLAVLEHSPEYYADMTHGTSGNRFIALLSMSFSGLRWLIFTLAGILRFLPAHIAAGRGNQ